jgi:hypothetical protein
LTLAAQSTIMIGQQPGPSSRRLKRLNSRLQKSNLCWNKMIKPPVAPATIALICLSFAIAVPASPQSPAPAKPATQKEAAMTNHATGPFDVKVVPQPPEESAGSPAIARMLLDKQFHGDLEATSKGTMLAAGTGAKNSSGGYVALEIVTGSLKGRTGTFVLQHSATMNRGVPQLSITVVPDSATGQLTGLAGRMNITIADGKHTYDLEYTLPETP